MQEVVDLIYSYGRAVWLKRWYALAVAWFVAVLGWLVVMKLPDQYQATARVNVDTRSFLRPVLRGLTFESSVDQQVQLMVTTLLSRPNLEKVARITDLDLSVQSDQEMDELLSRLKAGIQLNKADRRQDIYDIRYEDKNREVARKVVQAVLTVFAENTLGENRQESVTARRFLDAEIKEYEQRLKDAEARVVEFKRRNLNYLSSGSSDYYQRLQMAMADLEGSKLQLTEAMRQRDSVREQLQDQEDELDFLFERSVDLGSTSFDARIANLQGMLDEMLLKYTQQHPDVITLKSQIADLEQKRDTELASRASLASTTSSGNPVLQSLKLSLGQANAQVAALEARVRAHQERVSALERQVHTIPAIEAEMADLNRDNDVVKIKYNELITRREQANITQSASQASDEIQFKIIDPTRVPFEPSGPPRLLYMTAVFGAALAAGVGFALFLVLLKPTFSSARLLGLKTGLPVLGTVTLAESPVQISAHRRYLLLFLGVALLLVVSYSALLLVHMLGGVQQLQIF